MVPASSCAWWSRCCPEEDVVLAQGSGLWEPGGGKSLEEEGLGLCSTKRSRWGDARLLVELLR